IRALLEREPVDQTVVAFSLTPGPIAERHEHGAPPIESRIDAMRRLGEAGWKLGLRFDPLIYDPHFKRYYAQLFEQVFTALEARWIHSVSLGPLRFPKDMFDAIERLYPDDALFA